MNSTKQVNGADARDDTTIHKPLPRLARPDDHKEMSSSTNTVDYDALAATTSIEDITEDAKNQEILRSLRDDDVNLSRLYLCKRDYTSDPHCCPGSSEELGWLGHFVKNSAHLEDFEMCGCEGPDDIFDDCSEESVVRFFEDIGKCNRLKTLTFTCEELYRIIYKLIPVMKNSKINRFVLDGCFFDEDCGDEGPHIIRLFNTFRDMKNLDELSIDEESPYSCLSATDDVMAECIPSLADCTNMRKLVLRALNMSTKSCAALSVTCPRMTNLLELTLLGDQGTSGGNSIDDDCVEVLVRGLAECKRLNKVDLSSNRIGDDGLNALIQGLPASVCDLVLYGCRITLSRQLPLLRFKILHLANNYSLSPDGARVIATSLADPECRLEQLSLYGCNIEDAGAAVLATSLRHNRRLSSMRLLVNREITETGWDAFLSILCDTTSINATHGSNHTLEFLGGGPEDNNYGVRQDVGFMLHLNHGKNKSLVAAEKILLVHGHLDMKPLFDRELDLLPYVVAWLENFDESWLDVKLSSIFEFVRAMPMGVVNGVSGKKKGTKRRRDNT